MILEINALTKIFGGLVAINDVSFGVEVNTIKALIGPNGAGKTTLFNMVTGLLTPSSGTILFKGNKINPYPPHVRAAMGISRTFQITRIFPEMTVLENVMVGFHTRIHTGFLVSAFRLPLFRRDESAAYDKAIQELTFVGLSQKANQAAGSLPMGEQRLMEIARAMASDPEIVLFDEPAAGLNENETSKLADDLLKIKERGVTILLVEHDMRMVMRISDEITVINYGTKIAEGTPLQIRSNPEVISAYLGE